MPHKLGVGTIPWRHFQLLQSVISASSDQTDRSNGFERRLNSLTKQPSLSLREGSIRMSPTKPAPFLSAARELVTQALSAADIEWHAYDKDSDWLWIMVNGHTIELERTGIVVRPHFHETMRFDFADPDFPSKLAAGIKWNLDDARRSVSVLSD